jgi:hypothetical protein
MQLDSQEFGTNVRTAEFLRIQLRRLRLRPIALGGGGKNILTAL